MENEFFCRKTKLLIQNLTEEILIVASRETLIIKTNQIMIQILGSFAHQVSVGRKKMHDLAVKFFLRVDGYTDGRNSTISFREKDV